MANPKAVYFGGGRLSNHTAIPAVVQAVVKSGARVHVGCQFGVDKAVVESAIAQGFSYSLSVYSVAPPASALNHVLKAKGTGASVWFTAGGSGSVPIKARYIRRSIAGFSGCQAAVFFNPGAGSFAVMRQAVKAGIPVSVYSSVQPSAIPNTPGLWLQTSFNQYPVFLFESNQIKLF